MGPAPLVVVFVDGVGRGEADPDVNPLARARLDVLDGTGQPPAEPLDLEATLGLEGLPSSGTGQTTLLTGLNAARLHGAHFGPWTPVRLRPLLRARNFMSLAVGAGKTVRFLNAVPPGYPAGVSSRRIPPMALAAHGAGLLVLGPDDLARHEAIASSFVNEGWRRVMGRTDLPDPSPLEVGHTAGRLVRGTDLAVVAHYDTDRVGHRGTLEDGVAQIERVDAFLAGLVQAAPEGTRILVVSDHGNLEDVRVGHTRNPALGLWIGPAPSSSPLPTSLLEVAPFVLGELGE